MPLRPGIIAPAPDLIINGNYDWNQRRATGTHTTTFNIDTSFLFDRMFTVPVGASVTSAIDTTAAHLGSTLSNQGTSIVGLASVTTVDHGQILSSTRRHLYKQPLLFSCSIYNHTGADFTPLLRVDTPGTAETNAGRTFTNRLSQSLQLCTNGAVTRVSALIDPSVSATYTSAVDNGLKVYVRTPSGSLDVNTKDITVSQFSLKPANAWPGYLPPSPDDELIRSMGYFEKSWDVGVAVGTGSVGGGIYSLGQNTVTGMNWVYSQNFKAPKIRSGATVTLYDSLGASGKITTLDAANAATDGVTPSTGIFGNVSTFNFRVLHNGSIAGASFHYTANAELS